MTTITATVMLAAALMLPTAASAQGSGNFEWTISSSNVDPFVNVDTVAAGTAFFYLWYTGCGPQGMASAEFELKGQGGILPIAFTTNPGWLNAGNATYMLLAVGGCPAGPEVAGQIIASVTTTDGAIGLGSATATGLATVVECSTLNLNDWPVLTRFVGFASTDYSGTPQDHGNGCTTDAVEPTAWGTLKALYR
jgi:hypothetical protein